MSCSPLILPDICLYHIRKIIDSVWLKPYLWSVMKNGLRKAVSSLLGLPMQWEPSWLLQKAAPGPWEALIFSPVPAWASRCCPGAPWWTMHQSHPNHEYSVDKQIITAASNRAVFRGYQTFAEHKIILCFYLYGQRIKRKTPAPWRSKPPSTYPEESPVSWQTNCMC